LIDYIKDCHKKGMFVNVDVTGNPTKPSSSPATRANSVEVDDAGTEGHVPPVILNKIWRQVIHR